MICFVFYRLFLYYSIFYTDWQKKITTPQEEARKYWSCFVLCKGIQIFFDTNLIFVSYVTLFLRKGQTVKKVQQ